MQHKPLAMSRFLLAVLVLALSGLACVLPAQSVTSANTLPPPPKAELPTLAPVPTQETATVTAAEALNVRSAPGERQPVIGALYHGSPVTLTGNCSDDPQGWAEIEFDGAPAWVNADYLSENKCSENE